MSGTKGRLREVMGAPWRASGRACQLNGKNVIRVSSLIVLRTEIASGCARSSLAHINLTTLSQAEAKLTQVAGHLLKRMIQMAAHLRESWVQDLARSEPANTGKR